MLLELCRTATSCIRKPSLQGNLPHLLCRNESDHSIHNVRYIYTDYVLNISRADEVWNVTSIEGTPLSKQFYSDTHYFSNVQMRCVERRPQSNACRMQDGQWFWYFNSDGATCDLTKGIKGPSKWEINFRLIIEPLPQSTLRISSTRQQHTMAQQHTAVTFLVMCRHTCT